MLFYKIVHVVNNFKDRSMPVDLLDLDLDLHIQMSLNEISSLFTMETMSSLSFLCLSAVLTDMRL